MTTLEKIYPENLYQAQNSFSSGIYRLSVEETILVLRQFLDGKTAYQCADRTGISDSDALLCYHQLSKILGMDRV
ncbi:MAG: hypothetical protein IJ120_08000 [Solobacterium sp.]|nr:hypothetical protein [Solobacterium sp.]